jgi:hypothetical protein
MPLLKYDFKLDAGADWQYIVRLRDPNTGLLVPITQAVMEIRNANGVLALRLDEPTSRCVVLSDGASIQLHITAEDSLTYFQWGNYPGAVQAVGYWGIGRAYNYDLFAIYGDPSSSLPSRSTPGVPYRILRGFFNVDPNITQFNDVVNPALTVATRGSYD